MAAQVQVRKTNVSYVWPEQLEVSKSHRDDFGKIDELGKSILGIGMILQPLKVRPTDKVTEDGYPIFKVIIGNRRGMASQRVRDAMIPKLEASGKDGDFVPIEIVSKDWTDAEIIAAQVIADEQVKPRNLYELGRDIKAMSETMKNKEIAKMIGKSEQYVSDAIRLIDDATPEIIASIKDGSMTPYAALELIKSAGAAGAETVIEKAKDTRKVKEEKVGASKHTRLSKTELKEAAATAAVVVKKKGATGGDKNVVAPVVTPKTNPGVDHMKLLLASLEANAGVQKPIAFAMLRLAINYLSGKISTLQLMPAFFYDLDADVDAEYASLTQRPEAEKAKSKKETPAKPTKGAQSMGEKKAAKAAKEETVEDDEGDIEEVEAPKKPAKKTAGKSKPSLDEEEPEEIEELDEDDLDDEEDDDIE